MVSKRGIETRHNNMGDGFRSKKAKLVLFCLAASCLLTLTSSWGSRAERAFAFFSFSYASPGHQKMVALLKEISERAAEENPFIGEGKARYLRQELQNLPQHAPDLARWELHVQLGEAELTLGNEREAIQHLTSAHKLLSNVKGSLQPQSVSYLTFRLAVAHLRLGETENCCLQYSPESCILPIRGGGIHLNREGSKGAIVYFTEVLKGTPENSRAHLSARWLLNIAYMTFGGLSR